MVFTNIILQSKPSQWYIVLQQYYILYNSNIKHIYIIWKCYTIIICIMIWDNPVLRYWYYNIKLLFFNYNISNNSFLYYDMAHLTVKILKSSYKII
jgi:hypothetical protein